MIPSIQASARWYETAFGPLTAEFWHALADPAEGLLQPFDLGRRGLADQPDLVAGTEARMLGAAWVGGADEDPPQKLDGAIIFAPVGSLVRDALRLLRKAGTVALAGITMSPIPELDYSLLYQERSIRSVANCTREDGRDFLELAADANLQPRIQSYPLEQANQALDDLKHSRIDGAGVLLVQEG